MPTTLEIIRDLTRAKAVFQLRAVCAAIGIPDLARVEAASTGGGINPTGPAPLSDFHHQPLHHGSDSLGSVGSLGSIHDTEVRDV